MDKNQLIRLIAEGTQIPIRKAALAAVYFINALASSLKAGQDFSLLPVGRFVRKGGKPAFKFAPGFLKELEQALTEDESKT